MLADGVRHEHRMLQELAAVVVDRRAAMVVAVRGVFVVPLTGVRAFDVEDRGEDLLVIFVDY